MGPELCGKPKDQGNEFYRSPYIDRASGQPMANPPACRPYDPSVEGRFKLFVDSMQELLTPEEKRPAKLTRFDLDVPISVALRLNEGGTQKELYGLTVVVPKGTASAGLGNFQHKPFLNDLLLAALKPGELDAKLAQRLGEKDAKEIAQQMQTLKVELLKDPSKMLDTVRKYPKVLEAYSSCLGTIENDGHRFGTDLSDADKKALIAFLATL
jgi:hypothetical protein